MHIYNAQTKATQHKSIIKGAALQDFNVRKEIFRNIIFEKGFNSKQYWLFT